MNGKSHDNTKGKQSKSFAELAQEVDIFFKDLKSELLKFKQSSRVDAVFEKTEEFVQKYGKDVSTHQLRNIFQEIKKAKDLASLKLIRPNLAYIAGRLDKETPKMFVAFIDSLIKKVDSENTFENFKDFMEAIVAYHKFYAKQ